MKTEIDSRSGFCFGVINAIGKAEEELLKPGTLYCLGDIVHNEAEVARLAALGLVTIGREEYFRLKEARVLIRAHGEPPETYDHARRNNITLIDATCPVVLRLQKQVRDEYAQLADRGGQLLFYGKKGHAETIGINGQTGNRAVIVAGPADLDNVDFSRPVALYSQTTMPMEGFRALAAELRLRAGGNPEVEVRDTICRQVSNRGPYLRKFAARFDVVLFVAGRKSSNGAALFAVCREANPRTFFVESAEEVMPEWIAGAAGVGICGATSTPRWLLEAVESRLHSLVAG